MITWPMNADQFFNEKLIVEMPRVGAAIRTKEGDPNTEKQQLINAEAIKNVVENVVGESIDAEGMRKRAKELKEKAKMAVQEGGLSFTDLGNLIEELIARRNTA